MKRFWSSICLALGAAMSAHAAQPTDAQIDKLLTTMEMQRTLDEMFVQMDAMGDQMGQQMLGERATPEQRESLRAFMRKHQESMRKMLSWETLSPIYRRVYAQLFSAEEVDAMIAFYGSETGRGIMRKMPQAMQLTMTEMQPLMQSMIAEMQKNIERELQRTATDADNAGASQSDKAE